MIIKIKVKPNAVEDKIKKLSSDEYYVFTTEKASKNKANLSVLKILSREFNVHHSCIKIKNLKSRNKIVEINEV